MSGLEFTCWAQSCAQLTLICDPQVSQRVLDTDSPVIVKTKQLMAGATDVKSLAQGMQSVFVAEKYTFIAHNLFFGAQSNLACLLGHFVC